MSKKFRVLIVFLSAVIIGRYLLYDDMVLSHYYKSVLSTDKIRITDIDTGENVIYPIDDNKRKKIISSLGLISKSTVNFIIEDTQIYKIELLKKDKTLITTFVGEVQSYEETGPLSFQPTPALDSYSKNTLLYEYKGKNYIFYTKKSYIFWSKTFYEVIFDKIGF